MASPGVSVWHAEVVALAQASREARYGDKLWYLDALLDLLTRMTAPEPLASCGPAAAVASAGGFPSPPPGREGSPALHVRLASQVAVMRQQGLSIQAIAAALGTSTRTVGRALAYDTETVC